MSITLSSAAARCPLCDSADLADSSAWTVRYADRHYVYRRCAGCGSFACNPMPDSAVLAQMYGPGYAQEAPEDAAVQDPKDPERVLTCLRKRPPGVLLDFGCGSGSLLVAARALGWTAVGVEYQADVVQRTASRTGTAVFGGLDALRQSGCLPIDVIHLGDVVEHLTAPFEVLGDLVTLLRPGGWLVAQGPLEAGPCLFSLVIRAVRALPRSPAVGPPYHVMMATVDGQRRLFERSGLATLEYELSEVAWPAVSALTSEHLRRPRDLALFALRRVSQAVSALNPGRWGNRYFYVGVPELLAPGPGPAVGARP